MRRTEPQPEYAAVALLAGVFWSLSLFADVEVYTIFHPGSSWHLTGWFLLAVGWFLGPVGLSVSWYANIPLLVCIGMMAFGRVPNFWLATVSLGLALAGLFPLFVYGEVWGYTLSLVRGPAVWLWLASFAIVWVPVAYARWPAPAGEAE